MLTSLGRLFSLVVVFIYPGLVHSQVRIDDFENGLNDWTHLIGSAEVQDANEYSGANSVRLHRPLALAGSQTTIIHNTFSNNFGIYEVACFADGPFSQIHFLFQYLDAQNFYQITCNPRATDQPLFTLSKTVNGVSTIIDSIGPVVDLNLWFLLRVERYCDGSIDVYINDDLKISADDRSIIEPGTIGLGAWAMSTFFDDLTFESIGSDIMVEVEEFICSGRFYQVDTNRYSQSGTYIDTLKTAQGCDSVVRLQLTIVPHYLVTVKDTICAHEFYIFGGDTLRSSGRYNDAFESIYGCDSLVELNLLVLGSDTLISDTTICDGSFILFNDDTLFQPGNYYDTIFSPDGCFGISELKLHLEIPAIELGNDLTHCFDEIPVISLRATGFDSIIWFDDSRQETVAINAPGKYWVEVFEGNCSALDTIEIIEFCAPTTTIYIPNAFSPNGDSVNDFFTPAITQVPTKFQMKIFNRWGSHLFDTSKPESGWDGRVNGKMEPPGVYLYLIEVDGVSYTGTVHLIR